MRRVLIWICAALAALLLAAGVAVALAVEGAPRVAQRDEVSTADIDRAVASLRLMPLRGMRCTMVAIRS